MKTKARTQARIVALVATYLASPTLAQHTHHDMSSWGLANPEMHLFADPSQVREPYALAKEPINEFRLHDFYQRQGTTS